MKNLTSFLVESVNPRALIAKATGIAQRLSKKNFELDLYALEMIAQGSQDDETFDEVASDSDDECLVHLFDKEHSDAVVLYDAFKYIWKTYAPEVVSEDSDESTDPAFHWIDARELRDWFADRNKSQVGLQKYAACAWWDYEDGDPQCSYVLIPKHTGRAELEFLQAFFRLVQPIAEF